MIAASFSQTYLRNAYNNGFLCVEVPELVKRLREQFASEVARKEKTIIPGDEIDIDFTASVIRWRGEKFAFPALGSVPQSLVIAEGVETEQQAQVLTRLGCNYVQGHLYSEAVDEDAAARLVESDAPFARPPVKLLA